MSDEEIEDGPFVGDYDETTLTSVGIDIGSATSHVIFSRLTLRRRSLDLASKFEVVGREVVYQSGILFTPYCEDLVIDRDAIQEFIDDAYAKAGVQPREVDTGAVILTGVAAERTNAPAIAELFAEYGGKFVCATAGHRFEAVLAAHGSGAVALSASTGQTVLNIDIGGGTTKFSVAAAGEIVETMAIAGGGRILAWDGDGVLGRIETFGADLAETIGVKTELGSRLGPEERAEIGAALGKRILSAACGGDGGRWTLDGQLRMTGAVEHVVFSGGVGRLITAGADGDAPLGDLGIHVARYLREALADSQLPMEVADDAMRSTVIGASQFTMQASGSTVHVSSDVNLPVHNMPAVLIKPPAGDIDPDEVRHLIDAAVTDRDLDEHDEAIVVGIDWAGEPTYQNLAALARGSLAAHQQSRRGRAHLVVAFTADIALSVGRILSELRGIDSGCVVIDHVAVGSFDFVDVGERVMPANVLPVVVKSLAFSGQR